MMTVRAAVVNKKNKTVIVTSNAETLSLKLQELRGEEASVAATKQGGRLGLSRAGIGDERVAHLDLRETPPAVIDNVQTFCANPLNKGITPEPCRIFTLR